MPRIVSFLPAGTEIVHALGAGDELVGRSYECDYPSSVATLPVVSRPALALDDDSPGAIDRAVAERMESGASMYEIDEVLLRNLRPDVIITQDLCRVCAPSGNELSRAVRDFTVKPEILFLTPRNIAGIEDNIIAVGEAIGRRREARSLVDSNRARMAGVSALVAHAAPRRVVFLEWTDPLFCAGHWVPEMIALAGGDDPLGRPGGDSVRMTWDDVEKAAPEVIVVSPCGYRLEQSLALAQRMPLPPDTHVYAVDANAYYARPGPRVAEGVELLGHLFHPDLVAWDQVLKEDHSGHSRTIDLLQQHLRGDDGVEVALLLGVLAILRRSRGIVDHHRGAAAHQGAEDRERTAGRGRQHDADKPLLVLPELLREDQRRDQRPAVAKAGTGRAVDDGSLAGEGPGRANEALVEEHGRP